MGVSRHCDEPMWFLEIPGVYDGAILIQCALCQRWRHRFPTGHYLRPCIDKWLAEQSAVFRALEIGSEAVAACAPAVETNRSSLPQGAEIQKEEA